MHAFTDGRDTPPRSGNEDISRLRAALAGQRADRQRQRALLCDGPRQKMGAGRESLSGDGRSRWAALRRCGFGGGSRLYRERDRRVRGAGGGRRLRRYAGWRCAAVLQLPRRPGARDIFRTRGSGIRRLRSQTPDKVRRGGVDDPLQRCAGALCFRIAAAGGDGQSAWSGGCRRGADPATHGRDREICPCDLFPQRRRRDSQFWRGTHHGAVAQGGDLRSATGNVGAGN